MPTGYTPVTASLLKSNGSLIPNATIYFTPVANNGQPISVLVDGALGIETGAFSALVGTQSFTATTSASTAVTGISSMAGLRVGGTFSGPGIPSGATIAALGSGALTLDGAHAATTSVTGGTFTSSSPGAFDVELPDTSLATPINAGYSITVADNVSGNRIPLFGFGCFQPTGSAQINFDAIAPNLAPQITVQQGPAGATGAAGVASLASLATLRVKSPSTPNLFNAATVSANVAVSASDGTLFGAIGFTSSDFIPANSGASMATLNAIFCNGSSCGIAFYDQNQAFLSADTTAVAAGGNFSVPSGAAFLRFTINTGTQTMLVNGATAPGSFSAFGAVSPSDLTAAAAAAESAAIAQSNTAALTLLESMLPEPIPNWINPATVIPNELPLVANGSLGGVGGFSATSYIPVTAGQVYSLAYAMTATNVIYGLCWYDGQFNFLSGVSIPFTAGQQFTAPANAAYCRIPLTGSPAAAQMFVQGTTVPGSFIPYPILQVTAPTQATVSPGNGKRLGVLGDSISSIFGLAWQSVVLARLGMTLTWQSARPGRAFSTGLEDFSNPAVGSAPGVYVTTYTYPSVGGNATSYENTGITAGESLAASLTDVDVLVLRMGTNDEGVTVGTLGDATNAGTLYGNMRWVIEALLTAAPTVRLVMVGPALNGFGTMAQIQATDAAEQAIANYYALPYLSLLRVSGNNIITNASYTRDSSSPSAVFNSSGTTLTGMGTHPSAWNFANIDGPAIAQFIQQWI